MTIHRLSPSATSSGQALDPHPLSPLSVSFDEIAERLGDRADLFFEPDGSFVWRTQEGQLDGQLYDGPSSLQYVELKGSCTQAMWQQVIDWLSTPGDHLAVQHVETGQVIPEADFRDW